MRSFLFNQNQLLCCKSTKLPGSFNKNSYFTLRSLWSTLHLNLAETEVVIQMFSTVTILEFLTVIQYLEKCTMFNTTGKHWGHITWLFLLKVEYNKACSVYVKHSSINVNLIWTFIRRVRAGRAKSTWVDGVRKGSWYGCINPAQNECWNRFEYSESVCIDTSVFLKILPLVQQSQNP